MKNKTVFKGMALTALALSLASLTSCGKSKVNPYDLNWDVNLAGTKILFWTPFGTDIETVLELLVDEFSEQTGIQVTVESKGGYDALNQAISLSGSSERLPHISLGYPDHLATYVASDSIVRLDYYFENDGDDTFKKDDFYSEYMVENQTIEFDESGKGYTLGVPFNKSTEVLTYNKSFFDWAHTVDSEISVPLTWDDVKPVGTKILNLLRNGDGKASYFEHYIGSDNKAYNSENDMPADVDTLFDFSSVLEREFKPLSYDSQSNFFITVCRQWGGTYTEVDTSGHGYINFNSPEVKAGLAYMKDLYDSKVLGIPADFGEASYSSNPFKIMKSVMAIGSSAGVRNSAPTGGRFDIDVSALPYHDASKKFVISQGTNLIMLDQGSNNERIAAWKLLKFLSKEVNGSFAASTGYFPTGDYATQSADYQTYLNRSDLKPSEKIARNAALLNENEYMNAEKHWTKFVDPAFVGSSTVRTTVSTAMAQIFIDNKPIDTMINELYSALGDYVRK